MYFKWFSFQLIILPLNILILTLYTLETLFVGLIEHNLNIRFLGFAYLYFTFHMYLVTMAQVHAVVESGAQGRYTGVLVHQALTNTNDQELMTKVRSKFDLQT